MVDWLQLFSTGEYMQGLWIIRSNKWTAVVLYQYNTWSEPTNIYEIEITHYWYLHTHFCIHPHLAHVHHVTVVDCAPPTQFTCLASLMLQCGTAAIYPHVGLLASHPVTATSQWLPHWLCLLEAGQWPTILAEQMAIARLPLLSDVTLGLAMAILVTLPSLSEDYLYSSFFFFYHGSQATETSVDFLFGFILELKKKKY